MGCKMDHDLVTLLQEEEQESLNNPPDAIVQSANYCYTSITIMPENNTHPTTPCRICLEGSDPSNNKGPLISPCKCLGSLAQIHKSCLERWLSVSNTNKCEICETSYDTIKTPPSYRDYLLDPKNNYCRRTVIADTICFSLLTPVLFVSLYLCFLGAKYYFSDAPGETIGLLVLSLFLVTVYLSWCHITYRYHTAIWRVWKGSNQTVKLAV